MHDSPYRQWRHLSEIAKDDALAQIKLAEVHERVLGVNAETESASSVQIALALLSEEIHGRLGKISL